MYVGGQPIGGVGVVTAVDGSVAEVDLEVEVAAGGVAFIAGCADLVSWLDYLAWGDEHPFQVGVPGGSWWGPRVTLSSWGPAQGWDVSISTMPTWAARTGVPHPTAKSVPVCQEAQWAPRLPQLSLLVQARSAGTG